MNAKLNISSVAKTADNKKLFVFTQNIVTIVKTDVKLESPITTQVLRLREDWDIDGNVDVAFGFQNADREHVLMLIDIEV